MPIRPIDLQTLLMQLSQVGREQSAEKEGAALQSAMKTGADQKRLVETKEAVHRTEDSDAGAKAISDREGQGPSGGAAGGKQGSGDKDGESAGAEVVVDPDLGKRVDLSG